MEYIQAFLVTSKYIFGGDGNRDLFYVFSAFVLLFYMIKRREKFSFIVKLTVPFMVVCVGMAVLYPWSNPLRNYIFLAKLLLNITLMVFVAYNCKKWRFIKFVEIIVWIHAIETLVALILPKSSLWVALAVDNADLVVSRLRLFYMDAATMAFTSGMVLVILVYQVITEEIIWRQVLGMGVMLVDLYLSVGLSGIVCALLSIVLMLILAYVEKRDNTEQNVKIAKRYRGGILFAFGITAIVCAFNTSYFERIRAILDGTDDVLYRKLIDPLNNIAVVLKKTYFLGVGFGNANTSEALEVLNATKAYPNSFLRIIAEGGIFGIFLVVICIIGIGYYCFKYGRIIDKALYIYIMSYQMIGGYFTDSANFLVYGWIMGECLYNKVRLTGKCRIKMFLPKVKKQLTIAEIGHKRIPSREGGVEIVVEELSKRMVRLGHNVDAYNRGGQHVSGSKYNLVDYDNLHEYEGIHIIKIPTIQKKGFAALLYSFFATMVVITKDYDVVHYHAEGPCAFIWIPSLFGIRTVATIHGIDWKRSGKWGSMASTFIHFGEKMAVSYADEIIVLSKQIQKYFLDIYNRKTVYIPNGVDRPEKKMPSSITEKWGLEKDGYILLLARLTAEKGFHYAIEAFKEIDTQKKLVIAGGTSDSDNYVRKLKELAGDDSRIIFTGFVQGDDLVELYSNAYFYCLPSDLEGMPISLLEAMSYGNCCLVSDIAECTSVVGKHGVAFEQGNVEDLRDNMIELLENSSEVDRIREKVADYVCRKYQWDDVVEKTLALYMGVEL